MAGKTEAVRAGGLSAEALCALECHCVEALPNQAKLYKGANATDGDGRLSACRCPPRLRSEVVGTVPAAGVYPRPGANLQEQTVARIERVRETRRGASLASGTHGSASSEAGDGRF